MKAAPDKTRPWSDQKEAVANVIVDTPRGSRNKFKWDEKLGLFKVSHVLAAGLAFPFDFGFIPGTTGGDGDPLDVVILSEEPFFTGCLVETRLIGAIEAEQTQEGKTNRNDRLIGVAIESRRYGKLRELAELNKLAEGLPGEIEQFFIAYNKTRDRVFKPLRRSSAAETVKLVKKSAAR